MKRYAARAIAIAVAATGIFAGSVRATDSPTVWNFDGNFNATTGAGAMDFLNADGSWASFGTDTVNGESTGILDLFSSALPSQGLLVTHNVPANGGGVGVNQYTIVMDIKFPANGGYASLMQTSVANAPDNDGDWFAYTPSGATDAEIGINGHYGGALHQDTWHRIAVSVDLTQSNPNKFKSYVDGMLVTSADLGFDGGVDGRFELDPQFLLMTDNDYEDLPAKLSSVMFLDRAMSPGEIQQLGGPTAAGIDLSVLVRQWSSNLSGDWNDVQNWVNGVPNGVDAQANFLGAITAAKTIYTDSAVTVGSLKFDNANTYLLTGTGSLTLQASGGSATVDVVQGSHKINLPLTVASNTNVTVGSGAALTLADPVTLNAGVTLTKDGAGTLDVISTLNATGPATIKVNGGTTNFATVINDPNISLHVDPATVNVGANQTLGAVTLDLGGNTLNVGTGAAGGNVPAQLNVAALHVTGGGAANVLSQPSAANAVTVAGALDIQAGSTLVKQGAGLLKVGGLSIDPTGRLDLTDGKLAVSGGPGVADAVRGYLLAGRNGGAWTGNGIVSSTAGADSQHRTAIAYADASQLGATAWAGQPVDGSTLVTKYTWYGDANLDGKVNADDYALIDRGYARSVTSAHWTDGDFNYDGSINGQDYLLIDTVFVSQGGMLSPDVLASREAAFGPGYVAALTAAVPEPAGVALLGAAGLLAIRRRRRD